MKTQTQDRIWLMRKAELIVADADEDSVVDVLSALRESIIALRKSVDGFTYGKSLQGIHSNSETALLIRNALNSAEKVFGRFF